MRKITNVAMSLDLPGEFIYITQEVNCKEQSEKDDEKQVAKEALDIEELYLSRYKQLKSFVRKRVFNDQDAEDISQAAFVEAMQKRDAFRGLSRPDVWLFGIALNLVRNHSKKEKNRTRVWEENVEHYVSLSKEVEPDPSEADIKMTKRLTYAGKILGIELRDHIIITPTGKTFSIKQGILGNCNTTGPF